MACSSSVLVFSLLWGLTVDRLALQFVLPTLPRVHGGWRMGLSFRVGCRSRLPNKRVGCNSGMGCFGRAVFCAFSCFFYSGCLVCALFTSNHFLSWWCRYLFSCGSSIRVFQFVALRGFLRGWFPIFSCVACIVVFGGSVLLLGELLKAV